MTNHDTQNASPDIDLRVLVKKIETVKQALEDLQQMGSSIPALDRNCQRILASVKMLEVNFADVIKLNSF